MGLSGCGDYPTPFKGSPGATAERLARPTAPLLVVLTPDAPAVPADARQTLASDLASALRDQEVPAEAKWPATPSWRLVSTLEVRGESMVPVFTVKDPADADQGSTEGMPAPADAWMAGGPGFMRKVAADAAPRVAALLTSIRIVRDKGDPNSLLNRPPRVMVADVTGAPGDGNAALTRQVRAHLAEYGSLVQTTPGGADFIVRGDVAIIPIENRQQRVEIQWTVTGPTGDERGKVMQLNAVPAGMLDHYWGDVAVVVATEAAGGLDTVIMRQTGREEAGKAAPPTVKH